MDVTAFRNLPAGERERRVLQLIEAFWPPRPPPLSHLHARVWNVDDEDAFADQLGAYLRRRASSGSTGEILAARFVAQVWRNADLCDDVGHFDLVDAFERWDERRREIVRAWAREPWGA